MKNLSYLKSFAVNWLQEKYFLSVFSKQKTNNFFNFDKEVSVSIPSSKGKFTIESLECKYSFICISIFLLYYQADI